MRLLGSRSRIARLAFITSAFAIANLLPITPSAADAQQVQQQSCTWSATAEVVYYAMPDVVGQCTGSEQLNRETGLMEQRTSHGVMMRRPADGLTAFSDGTTLWVLGPDGAVNRSEGSQLPATAP
jgi:hypothetical protein